MTRLNAVLCAIAGVCLFELVAVTAFCNEGEAVTDYSFNHRQRTAAIFAHDEHNEKAQIDECSICHHLYQNGVKVEGESSEDMSCSDCHAVQIGFPTRPLMKA